MLNPQTRILVVDDFETIRMMLIKGLMALGFDQLIQAEDGLKGIEQIEQAHAEGKPFGAVFCDLNMPNLNGLDMMRICKEDQRFHHIPFIIISAEAERQYVVQALRGGAIDYIVKPFNQETLQKKIASINSRLKTAA